jgi:hypothetical protein
MLKNEKKTNPKMVHWSMKCRMLLDCSQDQPTFLQPFMRRLQLCLSTLFKLRQTQLNTVAVSVFFLRSCGVTKTARQRWFENGMPSRCPQSSPLGLVPLEAMISLMTNFIIIIIFPTHGSVLYLLSFLSLFC